MKEFIEGKHSLFPEMCKIKGISNPVILAEVSKRKATGFVDLTGKRFGKQICIAWMGSEVTDTKLNKKKSLWVVECDCGNIKVSRGAAIVRRESCGCIGIEKTKIFNTTTKTKVSYISFSGLWQAYKASAKKRGYCFELSKDQFMELTTKNCHYCDQIPSMVRKPRTKGKIPAYYHNGLDRINNDVGYIHSNVVPCCKFCNIAKQSYTEEYFLNKIKMIYFKNFN